MKTETKQTKIESLAFFDEEKLDLKELMKDENLHKTALDLLLPENIRLEALNKYNTLYGDMETGELLNKIIGIYQMSNIKILKEYLITICDHSILCPMLKILAIKALCENDDNDNDKEAYDCLCRTFPKLYNIPIPCIFELVVFLMKNNNYRKEARDFFCEIINNQSIECDYRFKNMVGIEKKLTSDQYLFFIKEGCLEFIKAKNPTFYKIISCQWLLRKCEITPEQMLYVEELLLSFATDELLDYNLRADATDVLLQSGDDKHKQIAREIIMLLGREGRGGKTIFDNAQNVHIQDIEDSVTKIIEFLNTVPYIKNKKNEDVTLENVEEEIVEMMKNFEKTRKEKITVALNRIHIDRGLYSSFHFTLKHILLKVWSYIMTNENKEEMLKRLLQELEEMSGTCSTGYASRLVNSITGFGEFTIQIGWREQIIGNFSGRLNAKIRDITKDIGSEREEIIYENKNDVIVYEHDDTITKFKYLDLYNIICKNRDGFDFRQSFRYSFKEHFQGLILEELTMSTVDPTIRKHFLLFFRENMLSIREEMSLEFLNHINETDFDLYFRFAISQYESGEYI